MKTGLFLAAAAAAAATEAPTTLKEAAPAVPEEWTRVGRASPEHSLSLSIHLKHSHMDQLRDVIYAGADPASPSYGRHLTMEQVNELTAPSASALRDVERWLAHAGVVDACVRSAGHDVYTCSAKVADVEALLGAEYFEFESAKTGKRIVRTLEYSLPEHIAEVVGTVGPTVRFPMHQEAIAMAPKIGQKTTPDFIREMYGFADVVASTDVAAATANFLEQYISEDDLDLFKSEVCPDIADNDVANWIGPNNASLPGIESSLDIDYLMGTAQNTPFWFWSVAGRAPDDDENEPFLTWLTEIADAAAEGDVPATYSISYADYEDTVTVEYRDQCDEAFAKLTATGLSFLSGSGDGGVEGAQPRDCAVVDGVQQFTSVWPTSSEWITSVGGTQMARDGVTEEAVDFSGGGFSYNQTALDWQADAIQNFLDTAGDALPDAAHFNAAGRGFPDVAAIGVNFQVAVDGAITNVGGTSASTPTFSGVVALLNDQRAQQGKGPMGYLNPFLYANADAFTDIVSGDNPGCGTDGFTAQKGWDPITGLGTPIWDKLLAAALALP